MDKKSLGTVLVILGLLMLVVQVGTITGEYLLLALGAVLIAAYYLTGFRSGFLIAGSILSAVTIFGLLDSRGRLESYSGALFFLFVGLAFAFVYVIEAAVGKDSRWAIFPSLALLALSGVIYLSEMGYVHLQAIGRYWPVLLIIAGISILVGGSRRRRR